MLAQDIIAEVHAVNVDFLNDANLPRRSACLSLILLSETKPIQDGAPTVNSWPVLHGDSLNAVGRLPLTITPGHCYRKMGGAINSSHAIETRRRKRFPGGLQSRLTARESSRCSPGKLGESDNKRVRVLPSRLNPIPAEATR